MKKHIFCAYSLVVFLTLVLFAGFAQAAEPTPFTWSPGTSGFFWGDTANWGSSGAPDAGYEQAIFNTKGTTADPILDASLDSYGGLGQLVFNDDGWTISNQTGENNTINFNSSTHYNNVAIYSYGSGINTIHPNISFYTSGQHVYTGGGNTLVIDQIVGTNAFIVDSTSPTSSDTGKIKLTGNNSTLTSVFSIRRGTLLVANNGVLGGSSGTVYLGESVAATGTYMKLLTDGEYTVSKNIEVRNPTDPFGNQILVNAVIGGSQTAGASQFTGTVTLNQTAALAAEGSSTVSFNNAISGAGGIKKSGTGTVILGHSNTYDGTTTINTGILRTNAVGALSGSTSVTLAADATLDLNGYNQWINSLSGSGGKNGGITLGDAQFTVISGSYSGKISGSDGSIHKTGAGTLTLTGANSYTGQTLIDQGTLLVNGIHTGGGAYRVAPNAILGGTGTINANITVQNGGILSPGTSSNFNSLDLNGNTSMAGTLKIEFVANPKTGVIEWDLLNSSGGFLNITNGTLDFDISCVLSGDAYVFASYSSLTGSQFANVLDLPDGYFIDYNYMNNNQIALVVPEPATILLLSLGIVALRKKP